MSNTAEIMRLLILARQPVIVKPKWDDLKEKLLTELWEQTYLSASEISCHPDLQMSRNAIIGKAHRLRLRKRRASPKHRRGKPVKISLKRESPAKNAIRPCHPELPHIENRHHHSSRSLAEAILIPAVDDGITIMELGTSHCRAVVGRGPEGLARYCGDERHIKPSTRKGQAFEESPYCNAHDALYYQPVRPR